MAGQVSGPIYVIDSSSWISIERSPAQNRILWLLGQLIEAGRAICPPEARDEAKSCMRVNAWLDQYKAKHVSHLATAEYLLTVGRVAGEFPTMAGVRGTREKADQYVVGMAAYLSETTNIAHIVVSEESYRQARRKIPTACAHFGVQHKSLMDMLRDEYPEEDI